MRPLRFKTALPICLATLLIHVGAVHADAQLVAISKTLSSKRLAVLIEHGDGTFTIVQSGSPRPIATKEEADVAVKDAQSRGKEVLYEYDDPHER